MKCMKCNHTLTEKGYCLHCGFNISYLIKAKNTANLYYNQGLERAKKRELSEAAALLETALSFDKEQIDARNLLGLVYHEMGQAAKAMHQWVISINIDIENNIAAKYLQEYQENEHAMQKADRGVDLYNQALYSARMNKEGMSLIKIEECCFVIPNFVDAHLLRALLYLNKQDFEQAGKALRDVLKIDYNNPLALRYLREIPEYDEEKTQEKLLEIISPEVKKEEQKKIDLPESLVKTEPSPQKEPVKEKAVKKGSAVFKVIGGIIAGLAMGVIIMWAVLVPTNNQSFAKQIEYVKTQMKNKNNQASTTTAASEEKTNTAQVSAEDLAEYTGDGDTKGVIDYMTLAMQYYKEGDAVKAAKALIKVDEAQLKSDTSKELYDEIKKSTFGEASTQLYNSGKESYDEQDYKSAIKDLKKAYEIDDSNVEAYYYLGLSYQANGDKEKAKTVFEEINTKFKGSDREHDAADRLTEMGY